jgi:hypothetical protein
MKYNPEDPKHRLGLAIHLMSVLDNAGFKRDERFESKRPAHLREHVYSREIKDGMFVIVYTSCSNHKKVYVSVRAKGNDAIRVSTIYLRADKHASERVGIGKQKRIHRTGVIEDIGNRMLERMRDAWRIGNTRTRCHCCGAPKFKSKKGNLVCANVCWTRAKPAQ